MPNSTTRNPCHDAAVVGSVEQPALVSRGQKPLTRDRAKTCLQPSTCTQAMHNNHTDAFLRHGAVVLTQLLKELKVEVSPWKDAPT